MEAWILYGSGFAEYVSVPVKNLIALPEGVSCHEKAEDAQCLAGGTDQPSPDAGTADDGIVCYA